MNTDIEFFSSEICCLYADMYQSGSFKMLMINDKNNPSADLPLFNCIRSLGREIFKGNKSSIKNVDDLNKFVCDRLQNVPNLKEFCEQTRQKMKDYSEFHQKNKENIEKFKEASEFIQNNSEKGYGKDFSKLYDFFGVDKNSKCFGCMVPLQKRKICGQAFEDYGFAIYYEPEKQEGEEYVNDSSLLKRNLSTPFHEGTHVLFGRSDIKRKIYQTAGILFGKDEAAKADLTKSGIGRLLLELKKYFENNESERGNISSGIRGNCLGAIDEAFAASSTVSLLEKYGKKPEQFYYGFEGANKLAKCTYPILHEYLNNDPVKPLDDEFFARLTDSFVQNYVKDKTLPDTLDQTGHQVEKLTPKEMKIASSIISERE